MAKKKKKDVTDFLRTGPRLLPSRMGRSKTSLSKSEQFWLTENAMNEIKTDREKAIIEAFLVGLKSAKR